MFCLYIDCISILCYCQIKEKRLSSHTQACGFSPQNYSIIIIRILNDTCRFFCFYKGISFLTDHFHDPVSSQSMSFSQSHCLHEVSSNYALIQIHISVASLKRQSYAFPSYPNSPLYKFSCYRYQLFHRMNDLICI